MITESKILQIRLKNCIQTILDLEPKLIETSNLWFFAVEFLKLKKFLEQIENMPLTEEDVARMELAATDFLAEIHNKSQMQTENSNLDQSMNMQEQYNRISPEMTIPNKRLLQ